MKRLHPPNTAKNLLFDSVSLSTTLLASNMQNNLMKLEISESDFMSWMKSQLLHSPFYFGILWFFPNRLSDKTTVSALIGADGSLMGRIWGSTLFLKAPDPLHCFLRDGFTQISHEVSVSSQSFYKASVIIVVFLLVLLETWDLLTFLLDLPVSR